MLFCPKVLHPWQALEGWNTSLIQVRNFSYFSAEVVEIAYSVMLPGSFSEGICCAERLRRVPPLQDLLRSKRLLTLMLMRRVLLCVQFSLTADTACWWAQKQTIQATRHCPWWLGQGVTRLRRAPKSYTVTMTITIAIAITMAITITYTTVVIDHHLRCSRGSHPSQTRCLRPGGTRTACRAKWIPRRLSHATAYHCTV